VHHASRIDDDHRADGVMQIGFNIQTQRMEDFLQGRAAGDQLKSYITDILHISPLKNFGPARWCHLLRKDIMNYLTFYLEGSYEGAFLPLWIGYWLGPNTPSEPITSGKTTGEAVISFKFNHRKRI
jgi:hypothetical protein